MTARSDGREKVVRFRFCPPGKLKPGRPKPQKETPDDKDQNSFAAILDSASKVKLTGFFLSETEITIGQAAVLLGRERFEDLRNRLLATAIGTGEAAINNKYLADALKTESDKLPIFGVTLDEAVTMCRRLSEMTAPSETANSPSIERRQFRLPSHAEWQFACRAAAVESDSKQRPHFYRWIAIQALDKEFRQDWKELVESIDVEDEDRIGDTQFDMVRVLEEKQAENPNVLKVLNAVLVQSVKLSRDITSGRNTAPFTSVGEDAPNAWGIHNLHDNVNEWTVAVNNPDRLRQVWRTLSSPSDIKSIQSDKILFLAGSNNVSSNLLGIGAWKQLTIWGGYPMDFKSDQIKPWTVAEGNNKEIHVNDQLPGVRMLMTMVIKENWFALIRRTAKVGKMPTRDRMTHFDNFRRTVAEVAPADQASSMNSTLGFYNALLLLKSPEAPDRTAGQKMLLTACETTTGEKPKGAVSGFLQANERTGRRAKEGEDPDRLFFRLLASEIREERSHSPSP